MRQLFLGYSLEAQEQLAQRENRAVFMLRLLVLILLLASAVGVSWFVHDYITQQELSEFEHQFHSDAWMIPWGPRMPLPPS